MKSLRTSCQLFLYHITFTKDGENIRVLNLNNPKKAAYLNKNGDVLETSMDDIELDIVSEYYQKNRECMEDDLDE